MPTNNKPFVGEAIPIGVIAGSGYSMDEYRGGKMDVSIRRADGSWLDVIDILFTSHTEEDMARAKDKRDFTPHYASMQRRLSFKQAQYVSEIVKKALSEAFDKLIPSDDEIRAIMEKPKSFPEPVKPTPGIIADIHRPNSVVVNRKCLVVRNYTVTMDNHVISYHNHVTTGKDVIIDESFIKTHNLADLIDRIFNRRLGHDTLEELQAELLTTITRHEASHASKESF